ncbi:uncharacterized protein STEHIDRAFT_126445 [Stereum hirsutum FP-91666 SS1]|uniref:Uncharacterized protein n=1 Tax=Stereum hirsutum (strain FP-91666) TaxID=721885 RepID=R7RZ32_STEHR|nr:uncharacterized protein STEHIDRAFT_126445 [Stereum hirsutum FP-91666 SS1]EIM79572.1 hypothetical protein STEHIDRAFT_126445 [Stereum hirsutum FP-91666 SS1]
MQSLINTITLQLDEIAWEDEAFAEAWLSKEAIMRSHPNIDWRRESLGNFPFAVQRSAASIVSINLSTIRLPTAALFPGTIAAATLHRLLYYQRLAMEHTHCSVEDGRPKGSRQTV